MLLGVPVLASVRRMDKSKLQSRTERPSRSHSTKFTIRSRRSAKQFARLRSGIHMSDVDRPPKVIHVTSSRPGEGKTTIAISLAISAAASGLKVALVDADLRHPSASRFFKLEKEQGLVDLLIGANDVRKGVESSK